MMRRRARGFEELRGTKDRSTPCHNKMVERRGMEGITVGYPPENSSTTSWCVRYTTAE